MMQFTRFIRKFFATTILLSGKFSLFVTLSPGPGCLCRHSEIHVHVLYLVFFMHNTDKTNRIEQNALKDQENEFGEVLGR